MSLILSECQYAPDIDSDDDSDFDSDEEADEGDDHDGDEDDYEDSESGSPSRKRRSLDDGGRKQGKRRKVDVSDRALLQVLRMLTCTSNRIVYHERNERSTRTGSSSTTDLEHGMAKVHLVPCTFWRPS